jgi:hypothetical protein
MIPRLGDKYEIEIEMLSNPKDYYSSTDYQKMNQPVAPAIKVGDEVVTEKGDITEDKLESIICKHLGLPEPKYPKKGFFGLFSKTK